MRGAGIGPRDGFFDKQGEVRGRKGADCVPAGQAHPGRSDKRTDRIDEAGCQQAQKHIPGANRA